MCEPTTVLALSSLAIGTAGQISAANAQMDALQDSTEAQADERSRQLAQQAGSRVRQGRRERARLRVAAGESGIGLNSQSFEAQVQNNFAAQNRDLAILESNAETATRGIQTRAGVAASRIDSGLQIAGRTAGQLGSILANRPPKPSALTIPTE